MKQFKLFFLILALLPLQKLSASTREVLPQNIEKLFKQQFETKNIISYEITPDKGTYFFNAVSKDDYNKLYCFYPKEPEKSEVVFSHSVQNAQAITDLIYNPAAKTLYFIVNYGIRTKRRNLLAQDNGIYTLSANENGFFPKSYLSRYYKIPSWMIKNVVNEFLLQPKEADFNGFLDWLFSFADYGSNPVFCLHDDNDRLLTNEAAVRFLMESGKLQSFCNFTNENDAFPINRYLYCGDKNGNPGENTAVSYYEAPVFYCGRNDVTATSTHFVIFNDTVFFTYNYNSAKEDGSWTYDYAEIWSISDDEYGFFTVKPEALQKIRTPCYFDEKNQNEPLQVLDKGKGLLINDLDGTSVWLFDGTSAVKFSNRQELMDELPKIQKHYAGVCYFIVFPLILLIILLIFLHKKHNPKENDNKSIMKIQEKERAKIAGDIHDSVVQDIRAIRIRAEMLKVQNESADKKKQLIEELTECIKKMRDICYGLSPAELKDCQYGASTDLLPILQSLASQFELKTNIPCSVQKDQTVTSIMLEKEDCQNAVRIVQEALKNIEKHSFATQSQILIKKEPANIAIFIIDDGKGCDLNEVSSAKFRKNHFGLQMIKERTALIRGASVDFCSESGDGMQIKLTLEC